MKNKFMSAEVLISINKTGIYKKGISICTKLISTQTDILSQTYTHMISIEAQSATSLTPPGDIP